MINIQVRRDNKVVLSKAYVWKDGEDKRDGSNYS